jgi:hypothetical protein
MYFILNALPFGASLYILMSKANDEKLLAIKTNITLAASARNETIQ